MDNTRTFHVTPAEGGEWAVEDGGMISVHLTQGLAVAKAWELAQGRSTAEVVVHGPGGEVLSSLSIRRIAGVPIGRAEWDDSEDEASRREAERITPDRSKLDALIDRLAPSRINYDHEDDDLPC